MEEIIYLGTCPTNEYAYQCGEQNYSEKALQQCRRYITQLIRMFGEPPTGAEYKIQCHTHEFGIYFEVIIRYSIEIESAVEYAFHVEANTPEYWDEQAFMSA